MVWSAADKKREQMPTLTLKPLLRTHEISIADSLLFRSRLNSLSFTNIQTESEIFLLMPLLLSVIAVAVIIIVVVVKILKMCVKRVIDWH